jgi:integrase
MPYFDQKKKRWRGVVKKDGKRYTRPFKSKTDAKRWEIKKQMELVSLQQEKTQIGMDLLTACEDYLDFCELRYTHDTYVEKKTLCKRILKRWGNIDVKGITPSMVLKHLKQRAERTSNNAWNRDRKNLLAMFNWIRKTHGIVTNAAGNVDRMPEERQPDYIPPAEDVDKIMMAASGQDRVMLKCYLYTFARRSELFNWTWEDINFEKTWYRLWTKKRLNGDKQADYFEMERGSDLYESLLWQWKHRDKKSPYVFTNPKTGQKYTQRRRFMKGLCERAGVKPFGFKAMRKFGPSVLNDVHKVSMKKLQKLLRHKSQTTTEIYLKNIDNDLTSAVRLLEKRDTPRDTPSKKELTTTG